MTLIQPYLASLLKEELAGAVRPPLTAGGLPPGAIPATGSQNFQTLLSDLLGVLQGLGETAAPEVQPPERAPVDPPEPVDAGPGKADSPDRAPIERPADPLTPPKHEIAARVQERDDAVIEPEREGDRDGAPVEAPDVVAVASFVAPPVAAAVDASEASPAADAPDEAPTIAPLAPATADDAALETGQAPVAPKASDPREFQTSSEATVLFESEGVSQRAAPPQMRAPAAESAPPRGASAPTLEASAVSTDAATPTPATVAPPPVDDAPRAPEPRTAASLEKSLADSIDELFVPADAPDPAPDAAAVAAVRASVPSAQAVQAYAGASAETAPANVPSRVDAAAVRPTAPATSVKPVSGPARSEAAQRAEFVQRVVAAAKLAEARGGESRLKIILQPPELGRLRAELSLRQQTVHVKLTAETPAAQDLIESNLPALRSALEQQGVRVGELVVSVSPEQRGTRGEERRHGGSDRSHSRGGAIGDDHARGSRPAATPRSPTSQWVDLLV